MQSVASARGEAGRQMRRWRRNDPRERRVANHWKRWDGKATGLRRRKLCYARRVAISQTTGNRGTAKSWGLKPVTSVLTKLLTGLWEGNVAQVSTTDARRQAEGRGADFALRGPAKAQRSGFRGEKEAQGSATDVRRQAEVVERTLRRRGHASPAAGLFASEISKERK